MPTDPRVDRYIADAPAYAQPILQHLRGLIHQACPEIEETIKWSRPFFLYHNKILCGMAAFKAHCGFGFWQPETLKLLAKDGIRPQDSSGWLGRITAIDDLPPKRDLLRYFRETRGFIDERSSNKGSVPQPEPKRSKALKPAAEAPDDFAAALSANRTAARTFEAFSPSHRREYIEWIAEAKRDDTRRKRIATALEWLAEGKPRHWKYQNC